MATTDTDALIERIARALMTHECDQHEDQDECMTCDSSMVTCSHPPFMYCVEHDTTVDVGESCPAALERAAAVLPIVAEEVRKAKAEAFDSFCNALADHLDLGTPRAWGFRHPCDPPGVRWEPTERDRALMDVADLVRNDTLNPYRETGDSDERR